MEASVNREVNWYRTMDRIEALALKLIDKDVLKELLKLSTEIKVMDRVQRLCINNAYMIMAIAIRQAKED